MSENHGLMELNVRSYSFDDSTGWLRLPPELETLQCENVTAGPPTSNHCRILLPNLKSLVQAGTPFNYFPFGGHHQHCPSLDQLRAWIPSFRSLENTLPSILPHSCCSVEMS